MIIKLLLILIWPVGVGLILMATAVVARRDPGRLAGPGISRFGTSDLPARHADLPSQYRRLAVATVVLGVGLAAAFLVMTVAGLIIVHGGPTIDKPLFNWLAAHHREHVWKSLMSETTQFGYKWTTWGAAATAGVILALTWGENRWLPPVVLGSLIVVDHYVVRVITVTFHRVPPPGATQGTFPSGGCDRVIVFYGLIAYLLWRELSGRRGPLIWAAGVVAALGFNESYSRTYLGLHWFTDTIGGLLLGCLELAVFVVAVELAAPRRVPALIAGRPVMPRQLTTGQHPAGGVPR